MPQDPPGCIENQYGYTVLEITAVKNLSFHIWDVGGNKLDRRFQRACNVVGPRAAFACLSTYVSQHPRVTDVPARGAPEVTLLRHRMIMV